MRLARCSYRLDELGWLQFERLCMLLLEREGGLADLDWRGHADQGRVALVDADVLVHETMLAGRQAQTTEDAAWAHRCR